MRALDILTKAQDLIRDPKNWTKGTYAREEGGHPVAVDEPSAVCFCSIGALVKVLDGDPDNLRMARGCLVSAVRDSDPDINGIAEFNDHHTHEEVMAVWDNARELARADDL